jgi:hypothetical protein
MAIVIAAKPARSEAEGNTHLAYFDSVSGLSPKSAIETYQ